MLHVFFSFFDRSVHIKDFYGFWVKWPFYSHIIFFFIAGIFQCPEYNLSDTKTVILTLFSLLFAECSFLYLFLCLFISSLFFTFIFEVIFLYMICRWVWFYAIWQSVPLNCTFRQFTCYVITAMIKIRFNILLFASVFCFSFLTLLTYFVF